MSDTILAIDLGRYKSVACVYDQATRAHTFRTVDSTPDGIDRLLARHPGAVVVEASAKLADDRALLESIPGVGRQTATTLLAELPAVDRLPSA